MGERPEPGRRARAGDPGRLRLGAREPVRLGLREFRERFPGQKITPAIITRAIRMGLISVDGASVVVRNPGFLRIGSELARQGIPAAEALDELQALQAAANAIAERFTRVFERHMWHLFETQPQTCRQTKRTPDRVPESRVVEAETLTTPSYETMRLRSSVWSGRALGSAFLCPVSRFIELIRSCRCPGRKSCLGLPRVVVHGRGLGHVQAFHGLTGDLGDEIEVFIEVQHGESGKFSCCSDDEVRY
jgi:hypothetical protein